MSSVDKLLQASPLHAYARWKYASDLRVLCYHGVHDTDNFRRQLDFLCRRYEPVRLPEVLAAVSDGRALPRRAVLITFDDGLPSHAEVALRELVERDLSAVFFVVGGSLNTDRPHWWDQVLARATVLSNFELCSTIYDDAPHLVTALKRVTNEERIRALERLDAAYGPAPRAAQLRTADVADLLARGQHVGDHSWSHPLLNQLSDSELEIEMRRSYEAFTGTFPGQPLVYAFPNGNYDSRSEAWIRRLGYQLAFLFDHRIGIQGRLVSRLRVSDHTRIDRFATIVSGAHPLVLRACNRL